MEKIIKHSQIWVFAIIMTVTSCTGILDKEPIGILDASSFFKKKGCITSHQCSISAIDV
jgi:hypothetical protein